jgi:hypothetical protein
LPTKTNIEAELTEEFGMARCMVLLPASEQDIDRMVTVFRACRRTRRTLLVDLYAAEVLRGAASRGDGGARRGEGCGGNAQWGHWVVQAAG